MDLSYGLFMAEQEGLLNTHEGKINRVIKEFQKLYRSGCDINSYETQLAIYEKCGLQPNDVTDRDIRKIKEAVRKRY
jgi:hypothetical protein